MLTSHSYFMYVARILDVFLSLSCQVYLGDAWATARESHHCWLRLPSHFSPGETGTASGTSATLKKYSGLDQFLQWNMWFSWIQNVINLFLVVECIWIRSSRHRCHAFEYRLVFMHFWLKLLGTRSKFQSKFWPQ